MRVLFLFLSLVSLGASPSGARADALPASLSARIGKPPRAASLDVRVDDEGARLSVRWGGARATVTLSVSGAREATATEIALAGGRSVAVVVVEGETERAAALVSTQGARPVILWSGHLDPRGDLGERRRDVIETGDRTGDGVADVIVGVALDSTRICGMDETLLTPRAVDPATGALRPVELRPLSSAGGDEQALSLTTRSPGPDGPPILGGLTFTNASSSAGGPSDPALVSPPVALGDGDPSTYWAEGRGGAGRWEFATARHADGNIRAFAVVLAAPPILRPSHFFLVGDAPPRLRVSVPADAPVGQPLYVVPTAPLSWRCVSVVLDDATSSSGSIGLAEVVAYGDLDFGEGLSELVEEIVADGPRGARAAEVLARAGDVGRDAILVAWPTLTATGRRRAVRVLAAHTSHAGALDALIEAAADEDEPVQTAALEVLVNAGEAALPALARLSAEPSEAGDRAALALATLSPDAAAPALLAALMGEGGTERRGLRRALQTAYRRGEDAVRARFAAFGEDAPPGPAASAALALAGIDEGRALSATLLARASTDAERFEDRYRLIKAAAELEAEARADAWLVSVATDAEEWMLRSEAIAALALRRSPRLAEAARRGLDDAYPRVRVAAADALGGDAASLRAVATLARRDPWPMVRASATSALGGSAEARPVVRAALGDRAQVVRAAAVRASIEAEDRGALDRVAQRLTDEDEWPEVIEAGIAYARELCLTALVDPLVAVLRRGMRPDAWAPDVDSAVLAVQALGLLGGQDARSALRSALSESAPGAIRAAAARAEREPGGCGAEN